MANDGHINGVLSVLNHDATLHHINVHMNGTNSCVTLAAMEAG